MVGKTIIGGIVCFDDGHEQCIGIGPTDAVDVLVRDQGLIVTVNSKPLERTWPGDVATEDRRAIGIRRVSWIRADGRREDAR